MRHGRPWREVMRAATSVDSAAVAASAWTFREAENSGAASLAGAPVTSVSPTGATADEASSRTSTIIPTTRTWITGTTPLLEQPVPQRLPARRPLRRDLIFLPSVLR